MVVQFTITTISGCLAIDLQLNSQIVTRNAQEQM